MIKPRSSSPAVALARIRLQILRNVLCDFRKDSISKTAVVFLGIGAIVTIAYQVSLHSFRFIETFPAVGPPLNSRLIALLFMVLFAMVAISTAIVAYTSLFLAKETSFFFENPISPALTFFSKVGESIAFSGWATILLCLPVLVAFGNIRQAPPLYYVEASAIVVLFVIFCGIVGTLVTLLLLLVVRRWTFRKLAIVATALLAVVGWSFLRSFDFSVFNGQDNYLALNRFTMNLAALQSPFVPSSWAASGILASIAGDHHEMLFQAGLLLANTLIFLPIFQLYGKRVYGRRWVLTAEPSPFFGEFRRETSAGPSPKRIGLLPESSPMASLIWKDMITFLRDPAQMSQFVLFVVLTTVYVLSLIQIPSALFGLKWRLVIYFANLAAISLILSSFTSRFLFPLISLEGRAFWILGLAPVERCFLIRQKVWFGRCLILSLGLLATLLSTLSLKLDPGFTVSALFTTLPTGWVLTALAVGLGAAYPNLSEDNPARIAVGLGGTLNFFASAVAVVSILFIEAAPYLLAGARPSAPLLWWAHVSALAFSFIIARVAVRLGEHSLVRMDF